MGTRGSRSNRHAKPQEQQQPRDEWDEDLNPEPSAGQNTGPGSAAQPVGLTAHDVKELHSALRSFAADELREIPILSPGERLEQGATYFDIASPARGEFTAEGPLRTTPENLYVPKARVHYELWNRLLASYRRG